MANLVSWLLPKEEKFFDMLHEQASNVVDGAKEFENLISNYNKLGYSKKKALIKKIKDIESKGDYLTHKIIRILDKTFITPIDKEDIYRLATLLDDAIDLIFETSQNLSIFKINRINAYIIGLTGIVLELAIKIEQGIIGVRKLKNMSQFYVDVHTLENKGDDLYHAALAKLFDKKDAIEIIKYKNIYEFLEYTIDKCEDIANVIESIVMKHA